ncbi:MAG: GldG family protein [Candidatus Thiodiazotropha sp. (ex Monitilora ramsayi)]|nr:GldG family protein [Candidatus Thiodiazotropha sp. (ex Monitilora ramsayi)]
MGLGSKRLHELLFHLLMLILLLLLAWLSGRFAVQWDWTRHDVNSLNPLSIEILSRTPGPIAVTAYTPENADLRDRIRRFIARYQHEKRDITLSFVDPLRQPDEARRQGISLTGEIALQYQDREERLQQLDEERFSNAILRLSQSHTRWVANLSGHGERDLMGKANDDLGEFGKSLNQQGYKAVGLDLATTPTPPDNTTLLVIAAPIRPFLEGELERLQEYLAEGGNLLLMSDPGNSVAASLIETLTGIRQLPGTIVDANVSELGIDNPAVALVPTYPDHPAVEAFKLLTLFPQAAALTVSEGTQWRETAILKTLERSWNETGALTGEIERSPLQGEEPGPLTLGYALTRQREGAEQRILVIGDSDFISNSFIGNAGNLDLGLALIRWLTGDDKMIGIPSAPADDRELHLSKTATAVIGLGSLIVLPLTLLLTGLLMGWRRNRA